jgi:hypothetical protein
MLVSTPVPYGYDMSVEKLSQKAFYELWANGTALGLALYPEGIDFGEFFPEEFDFNTTGFEVGVPTLTAISSDLAESLWNESNPFSLTNITGIQLWFDANSSLTSKDEISNEFLSFGITFDQINQILHWLWDGRTSFSQFLLPILINSSLGYGRDIKELARDVLYEQWANGTTLGLSLFPNGLDFGEFIDELPLGTVGFEVGIPTLTRMPIKLVEALWNESDYKSLLNITGIELWFGANTSIEDQATLISEYGTLGLTQDDLDMILQWLWYPDGFMDSLFPKLIESSAPYGYGKPIPLLAEQVFYEMWANGTALGLTLFPDGLDFSEFVDELPLGTVGFEVGIPTPAGMSFDLTKVLWDKNNEKSLLNITGIELWFNANESVAAQTILISEFGSLGLTQVELEMILQWLWYPGRFVDSLFPKLIESPPPYGYGKPLTQLAEQVFFEMWANGTALGLTLFPDGLDFGEFVGGLPLGMNGFEVGIPTPTGLLTIRSRNSGILQIHYP